MTGIITAIKRWFSGANATYASSASWAESAHSDVAVHDEPQALTSEQLIEMFYQSALGQILLLEPLNDSEQKSLAQLRKRLRDDSQLSQCAPRLPKVVPQLLRSLRDPNASADDQAEIIGQDPVLAANILRLANSPRFNNTEGTIDSFQRAIVILGNNGVRSIVSTVAMQPIMEVSCKQYPEFGRQIWQHSMATAVCAELLAPHYGVDAFQAYMAGLVRNIGSSTVFSQLIQPSDASTSPGADLMFEAIQQLSAKTSYKLAKLLEFDNEVVLGLAEYDPNTSESKLAKLLNLSQQLCLAYSLWQLELINQEQCDALLAELGQPSDRLLQLQRLLG